MSIATKAVSGAAWNLVASVGSRIVGVVGTVVLTRFVAPAEYGEIAAAQITIMMALTLTDVSVGQSIIARRVGPDVCFHAFVLHMGAAIVGLLAVGLLAAPVGPLLGAPGMLRFVPGFAVAALFERLACVPGRVLVRDMRFRTVALTRAAAELAFTGISVGLAPMLGGQAIVLGNIVRWALVAAVYVFRVDWREWLVLQRIRWKVIRDLLAYGLPLSAGNLAAFASGNWDNLLMSRFFGVSTMGTYRLARSLADTPAYNVAAQLADVLLPSFARMDLPRRRDALIRSASILALIMSPLSVGLAAITPTLANALFDKQWAELAPMLMILSTPSIALPLTWALASFLQAQHRTRSLMFLSFFNVAVMLLLVVTLGRLGPRWACLAVGSASVLHCAASLLRAHVAEGVPAWRFAAGVLRPLLACVPMFAAVISARHALGERLSSSWSLLIVEIITGAVVYVAAALIMARPTVRDMTQLLRKALDSRSGRRDRAASAAEAPVTLVD